MDIICIVLLIIFLLKAIATANAIRWLSLYGAGYQTEYLKAQPKSEEDFFQLFESLQGRFFPFGVKDFSLRRFASSGKRGARFAGFFQTWLFRYNRLMLFCSGMLCLSSSVVLSTPYALLILNTATWSFFVCAFGIALLAMNVLLGIESIFAYSILNDYATLFHMLRAYRNESNPGPNTRLLELYVFLGKFLAALCTGGAACYVMHLEYSAFKGDSLICFENWNILNWLTIYIQFVYFTATTMFTVGYGDIVPSNLAGQVTAFMIMLQGFVIAVLVLSALMSTASREK